MVSFSQALDAVKTGKKIARTGWNGEGMTVGLQLTYSEQNMTLPYLYIEYPLDAKTTRKARCPWLASQTDILAEDWEIKE